jgi:hypothetical protein
MRHRQHAHDRMLTFTQDHQNDHAGPILRRDSASRDRRVVRLEDFTDEEIVPLEGLDFFDGTAARSRHARWA